MTTLRITAADRDAEGHILIDPPAERRLSDLLPAPADAAASTPDPTQPIVMPTAREWAALVAIALLLMVAGGALWSRWTAAPAPVPAAASPPRTERPTPAPAPSPSPDQLGWLVGYWSPSGEHTPDRIDPRTINGATDRTPDGAWVRVGVAGGGQVWLRWDALSEHDKERITLMLPPTPTPAPIPTARPYVRPTDPPPPPCAEVGVPGKMVQACGDADLATLQELAKQQWIATYGGNLGTVDHPTPYGGTP